MGAPFIAAFDLGTTTGVAHGLPGSKPQFWSWCLEDAGKGRPRRLAYLWKFLDSYFRQHRVDLLYYEAPLNIAVMMEIGAQDETVSLLRGMQGILEAAASLAQVPLIEAVTITEARKHFCGRARFAKGEAKRAVQETCRMLGFQIEDEHQADALAIWSWAEARANPRLAHLTSPLFREAR